MKPIHAVLAAAITFLLAACYPPSTIQPVGSFTSDPKITGLWLATPAEKSASPSYYHFLPQADGSVTVVMVQAKPAKPGGEWSLATLTTSAIGPNTFMNARMTESSGKPKTGGPHGPIPLLYRSDPQGQVHVYFMNEKTTKAAIKAGKIKGLLGDGEDGDAVLTADQATLDKFLSSREGLALFDKEFAVLKKID